MSKEVGPGIIRAGAARLLRYPLLLLGVFLSLQTARAQNNVVTQHYDIARTGANTNETILTPTNVNSSTFGKLFTQPVDGYVYAQPLYLSGLTICAGTPQVCNSHNVIFIATEHDSVYAFDADGNLGANAKPLWQITLLDSAHGAAAGATTVPYQDVSSEDIVPEIGITSTPVIDPATNTLYVVGKTKESGTYVQRLHALDVTTGAEKFGGPIVLSASVPGNGAGSSGGTVSFDAKWENQRAGLLLLNGIVYIGFGSHGDNGPWHGWILAYNAATLQQTGAWCVTPNGWKAGIWLSGSGLAADVPDPVGHPFGRMFIATGNGTFDVAAPNYDNTMDYGDSIVRLDLSNGIPTMSANGSTLGDDFTPHNQSYLNSNDQDPASGGVLLLPDTSTGQRFLVQAGKSGVIYLLNRDNLGGYNPNNTKDPQEAAYVKTIFSMPAYWNGNVYFWATADSLKAFSFANGVLSSTPTSHSAETSNVPGSTATVSANGTTNGIVWNIKSDVFISQDREVLFAHDATNVATLLYSSAQNVARDNPGNCVKMSVPTVINGKVYVGAEYQVSVYGLLNGATQSSVPVISPGSQSFNPSLKVTITDSTAGVQIFYTTDGSAPTTASTVYNGPFTLTNSATVQAIAAGTGHLASGVASATYTLLNQAPTPQFTPPPGEYGAAQNVSLTANVPGTTIYYTLDGSTPTTSSAKYTALLSISSSTVIKAFSTLSGLPNSPVATAVYTIDPGGAKSINFANGFAFNSMVLNGYAQFNGTRLRITDGNPSEVSAAWYPIQVNVQGFTTDFNFQQAVGTTSITGDGITYTIQNAGTTAMGGRAALGYGAAGPGGVPGIPNSVAIKFDLYNNAGEGNNSTGIYTNGAVPTLPATTLGGGVNLHSGDIFHVHITYDGTTLAMTITDTQTNATFSTSWSISIPSTIGSSVAYMGFTGGTGGQNSVQDIISWTYLENGASPPAATPMITPASGTYSSPQTVTITDATPGSTIYYTLDGTQPTTSSTQYSNSFTVSSSAAVTAMATAPNYSQSAVTSSAIAFASPAATPVISPASGTYPPPQTVTITDTTSNSTIYYTLDGSQPTTSSTQYTSAFTVNATTTVKAIATAPNFAQSATASSAITIAPPAATPSISPVTGTYSSAQTVTITDATSSSTIYYTLDSSQPTTSSTQYTAAFTVSTNTTVKAIAIASGFTQSATATSVITIGQPTAATPVISPSTGTYSSAQTVTITDATSGSTIYYTLDGSQPTNSSTQYTATFSVSTTTTVKAIATASGFTQSATATSVITISQPAAATPVISPVTGTYSSAQSVTITDATSGSTIYYTLDGSQPTTSSTQYTAAFNVSTTTTVKAIATASGFTQSATATSVLSIRSGAPTINFASGFTTTGMQFNGHGALNGTRLQLADNTSTYQAGSAFWATPVNVQTFATDFTFQTIGSVDGITFTIQNAGPTAIGSSSGGLGYGPRTSGGTPFIAKSVAVKFDLYNNAGEGNNSTGLYTNGAMPTVPATTIGGGVSLRTGHLFQVHMNYDGTTLTMSITDATNTTLTFTTSWAIDIPGTVGGTTAYVGFTGGTGAASTEQIATWSY